MGKANALGHSRMEKYLAVIKVLGNWDSITQKQIVCKADFNLAVPKDYFNFLVKLGLIIEKTIGKKRYILSLKEDRGYVNISD